MPSSVMAMAKVYLREVPGWGPKPAGRRVRLGRMVDVGDPGGSAFALAEDMGGGKKTWGEGMLIFSLEGRWK